MKRYKRFMDGVKASDTLNQRLRALKEPKKRPAWTKYSAMAAALILVFGLGAYGLNYLHTVVGQRLFMAAVEKEEFSQPDIALAGPGDAAEPGEKVLEGYDVQEERGGVSVVCHYILPYIDYGASNENAEQKIAMDWAIQEGAVERELTQEEIIGLLGGQNAVSTHLDWDAYELTGRMWEWPDGSMLLAFLYGYQGPLDHFEFAVMDGELPPTCIAYAGSVTQEVRGLTVTADKYDGEEGCDRRVSFMKDDYGYRFDLTSTDTEQAERLVSRLVCCVADERLALWTLDPKVETYTCPDCGQTFAGDSWRAHVHSFSGAGESSAPAVSAEPGYTCPTCGETVPAGMSHDCAMCDGYPVPHVCEVCGEAYPAGTEHQCELCRTLTCPDCGASYPAGSEHECELCGDPPPHTCEICGEVYMEGTAHSHEICGYPLAPDTHVCEVCGQTIPVGVEHSHQEDHHGSHH